MPQTARTSHQVSLDERLLTEAKELKIDVSTAASDGVAQAIKLERERLWMIESADAIRQENEYIEKHGLPFAKHRVF